MLNRRHRKLIINGNPVIFFYSSHSTAAIYPLALSTPTHFFVFLEGTSAARRYLRLPPTRKISNALAIACITGYIGYLPMASE